MKQQAPCPDLARLQALADDALLPDEEPTLTEHLNECDRCRQILDRLLAGHPAWSSLVVPSGPGPDAPGSEFRRALERLRASGASLEDRHQPPAPEQPALEFLSPPDRPEHLGRLGPYQVLEVIGQGGMGIVLKALDPALNRFVAVKVLAPHLAANAAARLRFAREGRAAAAIHHEHVVAIHAVDEAAGLPYLVMEYVPGLSLQELLDRTGPLEVQEVLGIGVQAASGLAAAHAQGLVHRDVKPANILQQAEPGASATRVLGEPGASATGGCVKITDFGLARAGDDASITQSGFVAGTPDYMAPEQARGEAVDHRADLFSLGSVLYALCAGQPPFQASGALAVLRRVSDDAPRPVREINPAVPEFLAEIIGRLHAKDPAGRFSSAAEVAELLGKHLAHLQQPSVVPMPPRLAAPTPQAPTGGRRGRRWAAGIGVLLGLLALFVLAEAAGLTRLTHLFNAPVPLTPAPLPRGERGAKEAPLPSGERGRGEGDTRIRAGANLQGHKGAVRGLDFAPDGKTLASGSDDGTVRLWDVVQGRVRATLEGHTEGIWSVRYSRGGELLASGSGDGTVKVWESATGRERTSFKPGGAVYCVAFAPDARRLAAAGSEKGVSVYDLAGEKEEITLKGHTGTVYATAFTPDGRTLATGGADGFIRFWDPGNGQQLPSLEGHALAVRSLRFSPDGHTLATGHWDTTVKLWDVSARAERLTLRGQTHMVMALAFSPDGRLLASATGNRTVMLWEVKTGEPWAAAEGPTAGVYAVAFSPDGRTLATGGGDGSVQLWDLVAVPDRQASLLIPASGYDAMHQHRVDQEASLLAAGGRGAVPKKVQRGVAGWQ